MIEIQGAEELISRFEQIKNAEQIQKAVYQSCLLVERDAKQKAPKDTGALRRSITSRVENNGGELVGVVYTPLEYAPYIEFGTGLFAENGGRVDVPWNYQDEKGEWHKTSGMKPQPFLRPALEENREQIFRILKEGNN